MLDDTYYDDFLDVSFERIFRNKLTKEEYKAIIDKIGANTYYFKTNFNLI